MPIDERTRILAQELGERRADVQARLYRLIEGKSDEQVQACLTLTEQIQATGGLPVFNGSRKRTKGGIFFLLMKRGVVDVTPEEVRSRFPIDPNAPKPKKKQASTHTKGRPNGIRTIE